MNQEFFLQRVPSILALHQIGFLAHIVYLPRLQLSWASSQRAITLMIARPANCTQTAIATFLSLCSCEICCTCSTLYAGGLMLTTSSSSCLRIFEGYNVRWKIVRRKSAPIFSYASRDDYSRQDDFIALTSLFLSLEAHFVGFEQAIVELLTRRQSIVTRKITITASRI